MLYDIIVIGAGTAGMTAALYAKRAGKTVLLLESESFGGQISYTPRLENYPGLKQVSGAEFSSALFDQVTALGAEFDLARADRVVLKDDGKTKTVFAENKEYNCKAVIIATGVKPRRLGLKREEELTGEGVCYCAVCDGAFYAGLPVAVVGGGNTALTDALFLSSYCPKVYLIQKLSALSAEKILVDRIKTRDNIEVILEASVSRLNGEKSLESIEVEAGDGTRTINVSALFVAIGQLPDNRAFANLADLDQNGFIRAENCRTATEGVFAAGDCRAKELRQLTTAVSDGAVAAIAACRYCDAEY